MSGKQSLVKKEWLKQRFDEGLVFYRSEERGKCFSDGEGFVLYYTDQCPYTYYWVPRVAEAAKEHGIALKTVHITAKEAAQNVPAPVTTYALFRDGRFVTQSIQPDKALTWLTERRLDVWTHNKTIQKAVESYRISAEMKQQLRGMRIQNHM